MLFQPVNRRKPCVNTAASGEGPVDILVLEVGMTAVFVF